MTERLSLSLFTVMHWRRKWQPTPLFLPGVGCHFLLQVFLWVPVNAGGKISRESTKQITCSWEICPPLSSYYNCVALKRWLDLDEVRRVGPRDGISALIGRGRDLSSLSLSCEDTIRRWSSASQEESSQNPITLGSDFRLPAKSRSSWTLISGSQPPDM